MNKLKKKEQRANAIAAVKDGKAPEGDTKGQGKKPTGPAPIPERKADDGSDAIFVKYEPILEKSRFLCGSGPTQTDKAAMLEIEPFAGSLSAAKFPHLFSWYCLVSKYHPMAK